MKYICTTKSLYYKNKFVGQYIFCCIVEDMPDDEIIEITWDNLHKIPMFLSGYCGYRETKHGKKVILDFGSLFFHTTIKEWKQKYTNLKLVTSHKELMPSIQELLNFHDGKKAAKYLIENFGLQENFLKNIYE